jgi:hypothetical protein
MDNLLWRAAEGGVVIVKIIFWDRRAAAPLAVT